MLWKTHIRISFETLRRLDIKLTPQTEKQFKKGIIAPDKWKNYPHHHGKTNEIKQYLVAARKCYLQDEYPNAFFNLGVAFHYIQDSHTSFASFYPKHQSWEQSIEKSYYVSDLEKTINFYLKNKKEEQQRCLRLNQELSKTAYGKDQTLYLATLSGHEASKSFAKPIIDLNLALKACYEVAKSVLGSKNLPELDSRLNSELSKHEYLLQESEIELSKKIIALVKERENLQKMKKPSSGLFSKINNGIIIIRIKLKDMKIKSNYDNYQKQKHLDEVAKNFLNETEKIAAQYKGWYTYIVPFFNKKAVTQELLTTQEVSHRLNKNEVELEKIILNHKITTYKIGEKLLVKLADLDELLQNSPMNGFSKYPHETIKCG